MLPQKRYFFEKLPDPKLYDGDKQKLQSWIYSLKVKLARNTDCYPTKSIKIQDSIGHLTKKTLDQVKPRVKKDGIIDFVIVSNLIIYLKVVFRDPDEKKIS